MIGPLISPILEGIEKELWTFEARIGVKPNYPDAAFRAATKIFMSVLMDKMYELQDAESLSLEIRCAMAEQAGKDIRKLVKTYTNIDTHELF